MPDAPGGYGRDAGDGGLLLLRGEAGGAAAQRWGRRLPGPSSRRITWGRRRSPRTSSGEEIWLGPFEPFGTDYLAGTAEEPARMGCSCGCRGSGRMGGGRHASLGADLYYNVHRWYENPTARYTRPDPEWTEAFYEFSGQPAQVYGYSESRPTAQVDPLGLAAFKPGRSCKRLPPDKSDRLRSALADAAGHLSDIKPCGNLSQGSRTIIVRCGKCGRECGHFRPRIVIFKAAICVNSTLAFGGTTPDGKSCGVGETCLASTLLHEMVHACGGQHPTRPGKVNPYACEKRFYPNCRQHIPNDAGDCPCSE